MNASIAEAMPNLEWPKEFKDMSREMSSIINMEFATEFGDANCSLGSNYCFRIMLFMCSTAGCSCSAVGTPRKLRSAATLATNCMARAASSPCGRPRPSVCLQDTKFGNSGPRGPLRNGACRSAMGLRNAKKRCVPARFRLS